MTLSRVQIGDIVRLYGFRGTFEVQPSPDNREGRFYAKHTTREHCGWGASEVSIVEINGEPVPLQSCPIAMPAEDYPHVPQFEYNDGPQDNGHHILAKWKELHCDCGELHCRKCYPAQLRQEEPAYIEE